ncbi:acyltransferase family protein [Bacillus timonensis]|uniref:acyltransferase family protein n=1 Tax=Bacillus timonensis TaxID=1033734 RepID=UPI00028863BC|nr:acyltransferase [Bacillus timonensis]
MKNLNLVRNNCKASSVLDFIRFLSALTVFLFHFYVPLPGYQAVMVFFVLSGYFISSSILKSISENRWSWSDYLLKRITRLFIVLIPALLLTYIWAKIQLGLFGEDMSPLDLRVSDYLTWELLIGNLFFLQGIITEGPFGLNGPLWSLTYEFWYYILFPCIILIFHSRKKSTKFFYLIISITISIFIGKEIMSYFLVWLLGAAIPLIKGIKIDNKALQIVILVIVSILAVFSLNYKAGSNFLFDLGVGLSFSVLTYFIISFLNESPSSSKFNIPKYLAGFSYTLYLTHYPLANFILTWRVSPLWPFEDNSLVIKGLLAMIVFGYAWIIGLLTEKHTDKVRKRISMIFYKRKPEIFKI